MVLVRLSIFHDKLEIRIFCSFTPYNNISKFGHPIRSGKSERDYNQRLYETYTDKCVDSVYRHGYDF